MLLSSVDTSALLAPGRHLRQRPTAPLASAQECLRPGTTERTISTYDALIHDVKQEWLSSIDRVLPDVITRINQRTQQVSYTPFADRLRALFPDGIPPTFPGTLQRELDHYVASGLLQRAAIGPYQLTLSVTYRHRLQDPKIEGPLLNVLWQRMQEAATLSPPDQISKPIQQFVATAAQRA